MPQRFWAIYTSLKEDPARQHLDLTLVAGKYNKIYCPAKAFDPLTKSGTYEIINPKPYIN